MLTLDELENQAEQQQYPDPEALPVGLPPVAPFRDDLLPSALKGYVMDIAERLQCPPDFPAVGFVVALSSLIGARLGIRPKQHDDWLVVPNLWGAIVGRPSVMKTPALQEPLKMLHRLEALNRKLHEEQMQTYRAAVEVHKAEYNAARKAVANKLQKGETDKAALAQNFMQDNPPDTPVLRRHIINDATVEKLGEILQDNPEGVLLFRDELTGWLRSLDRDGHEGDRAFYLESWTGARPFTYDRIGRGTVFIKSCTVSMLGGIQPGPLRDYVSSALKGGAGDDGLLQRFQMVVWPDVAHEWRNVDRWPDTEAKGAVWRIVERMAALDFHHDEDEIPFVRFGPEAQDVFDTWRERLEHRLRNEAMPAVLEAHMGKFRSLVPSLALIFHLIDEALGMAPIRAEHVTRAIAWAEYLETHARRVYSQALDPGMAAAIALSERLESLPDLFSARDIYRNCWAGLNREATDQALTVLLEFGHVIVIEDDRSTGRPTTLYRVNPKLKNISTFLSHGTAKTDKRGGKGGFGSFVSTMNQESEKFFSDACPPGNADDYPGRWPDNELVSGEL